VRPPSVEREHENDDTRGEDESEKDADIQKQGNREGWSEAKPYFTQRSSVVKHNRDPSEAFMEALKRIVEAAGGTFSRLADQ
jgi:hypothetical protein